MSCNFHQNEILHVPDRLWRDPRFAAKAAKQYRFIHGHLHFEFICNLVNSTRIVTFLRDPVERVLSLYFFLRNQDPESQGDSNARFTIEQARSLSLGAFVSHTNPVIESMVGNFQVQMLLSDLQAAKPTRTWVETALANLQKYEFVGIADPDLMPDSMLMMSRVFGWIERGESPRVNHTARPARIEARARARGYRCAKRVGHYALPPDSCGLFDKNSIEREESRPRKRDSRRTANTYGTHQPGDNEAAFTLLGMARSGEERKTMGDVGGARHSFG